MNLLITIAVPLYGDGKEEFWNCLEKLRWYSAKHGIDTVRLKQKCCYIHHNRNLLVEKTRTDYPASAAILWLDSDMFFEPDLLMRLLAHNKPIVCTNYYRKGTGNLPVAARKDSRGVLRPVYQDPDRTSLEEVDSSGLGACLTWVSVYDRIKFPWFENQYETPPPALLEGPERETLIQGKILVGEDVFFFRKAKKAGSKVYCDFSIKVGHIGDYVYDWRDYERNASDNQDAS